MNTNIQGDFQICISVPLSCFAVLLRGIHGKDDICQTDDSIHSKLRISPYCEGKYNIQANERLTKIREI